MNADLEQIDKNIISSHKELGYDLSRELDSLSHLLEDYYKWQAIVLEKVYFPQNNKPQTINNIPSLFIESLENIDPAALGNSTRIKLDELRELHNVLEQQANNLCTRTSGQVNYPEYKIFTENFRRFLTGLQFVCQNLILTEWGLDILTGLRNEYALSKGLNEELERLSRHGHAFSVVLLKIDNYEYIRKNLDTAEADNIVQHIARFILKSLRSFDDAYYIRNGEFVLSLKQSDIAGGQRALERLQGQLSRAELQYEFEGDLKAITLSCCVSEPMPEENVEVLIDNLRSDLQSLELETGAILTYHELSPLQKFLEKQK